MNKRIKKKRWKMQYYGIPAEEVFPDRSPASILCGYMYRDDISATNLARLAGIPLEQIDDMVAGKMRITEEHARRFAATFNTCPEMFLF